MPKRIKTIPGRAIRGSRYMRRHPEEEKIIPKSSKRKQEQESFLDEKSRR